MDDFNYSKSYGTGWRKLHREESESGKKLPLINQGQGLTEEKASLYEENHKKVMNEISKIQDEITSIKELLRNIHSSIETMNEELHKNVSGRKLLKFFR